MTPDLKDALTAWAADEDRRRSAHCHRLLREAYDAHLAAGSP